MNPYVRVIRALYEQLAREVEVEPHSTLVHVVVSRDGLAAVISVLVVWSSCSRTPQ